MLNTNSTFGQKDKKIPDYSMTERKDIPVEYTWKIDDLYPNDDAWRADKDAVVALISKVDDMQ
jgi:oligoendopeptidase F